MCSHAANDVKLFLLLNDALFFRHVPITCQKDGRESKVNDSSFFNFCRLNVLATVYLYILTADERAPRNIIFFVRKKMLS